MTLKDRLKFILDKRLKELYGAERMEHLPQYVIERPREVRYGEYSTNVAMQLAPIIKENPMNIAQQLIEHLKWPSAVGKVLVVAPGFINFYLGEDWLRRQLTTIQDDSFGQLDIGKNKKVLIEFISANPTGPLHMGTGRGAFLGDVLANVMTQAGWRVKREYYVNDIGKQINVLAESVTRRFFQAHKIAVPYPEYCYQGGYIFDLAKKLDKRLNSYKLQNVEKVRDRIKGRVLDLMLKDIMKLTDKKLGIKFDRWFTESSLHKNNTVKRMLSLLHKKGFLYIKDDALWMKTTEFGDDKDRVLIKSDSSQTYFLSDIAYHWNKLGMRKFDKAINILGADHHGYVDRLQAAVSAMGYSGRLEIIIVQLVRLMEGDKEVKMSKRGGTFVTLDELVDEVGLDAVRFFFLMHSAGRHMEFNLDLAKKKSDENPVYYVQYAHARIHSIIDQARPLLKDKKSQIAGRLTEKESFRLIKKLLEYPELVETIAETYEVQRLPFYAIELAETIHDFYQKVRVIDGAKLNLKRYELIIATAKVLKDTLSLMGVSAPVSM
ncbi:MAG: arginine--tRNA ligase [Patescibacteria group bacterium]